MSAEHASSTSDDPVIEIGGFEYLELDGDAE
jgi:hypothetical protein